ncbi:MAG: hypothetical protein IT204_10970 [Fimbriimonadaceae bacterium]|nr:hypothetical protein [Fimbriimonadaceae bacterium]
MARLVCLIALLTTALSAQTLRDDFSSYPALSDGAPHWEPFGVGWETADGAMLGDSGFLLWQSAPLAAEVTYSADVTVLEPRKGDWLTGGIGLYLDERNHWALNFVMAPEAQQRKRYLECQEMLDGVWLASSEPGSKLDHLVGDGGSFAWELNHPYRLELSLNAAEVRGRVLDGERLVGHFGWRLAGTTPAVRAGRPALRAGGLRLRYDNVSVTVRQTAPEPSPAVVSYPRWVPRPGTPVAKGTGFFEVAQRDGRWWVLDPEGKPYYIVGTDHISFRAHWCEKLGYAPYSRNVQALYGSEEKWGAETLRRLRAWNFNTLAAGHSAALRHQGLPHILFASFGSGFAPREYLCEPIHWTGFPDVFSPRWEQYCKQVARSQAKLSKGDPWVIGTFLDNELEWYGKTGYLVDEIFKLTAAAAGKQALWQHLLAKYKDAAGVNKALGTTYADAAAFLAATAVPPASPALQTLRSEFLTKIAERYFAVATKAMRAADPDHLVMGCRFAGRTPTEVLAAAGKYNDIFTINTYPRVTFDDEWQPGLGGQVQEVPQQLAEYYRVVKRPMIITEWSFPALDSGLPCRHGAGMRVATQAQKAACYRIFAQQMADLPFMVGYHYFMWADEPELGISSTFPEDSNYGLVDVNDKPYPELTAMATAVNAQAAVRHARSLAGADLTLATSGTGVVVSNPTKLPGRAHLRLATATSSRVVTVDLAPGKSQRYAPPAGNPWFAELLRWDGSRVKARGGRPTPGQAANLSSRPLSAPPLWLDGTPGRLGQPAQLAAGEAVAVPPLGTAQEVPQVQLSSGDTAFRSAVGSGPLARLQAGELPLGDLAMAVHQRVDGHDQWVSADTVESLRIAENAAGWVVEAVVARRESGPAITAVDAAGQAAAVPSGPATWRGATRLAIFRQGGLALVKPLWVESTDRRTWELVDAFFFCQPTIGGDRADDVKGGPDVPNYYLAAQFWTDRQRGGCFGAAGEEPWRVMFWTDPGGGYHPDIYAAVNQNLAPRGRWTAKLPPFWVYGAKDVAAWQAAAQRVQDARALALSP